MLISPPFLPSRATNQTDADWLESAMRNVASSAFAWWGFAEIPGSYPISLEMEWHGGSHLLAPVSNNLGLPVRAIADGTVSYIRQPTKQNENSSDPLNYGAAEGERCWTSDGVVLIRHETDIGASADGQAVSVVFYSLYMHLEAVAQGVRMNQRIYRKDEIGTAGYIYGQPHRIHFEIFCDDDNLLKLINRQSGDLSVQSDGRRDVVFGEIYLRLPKGTPVYTTRPLDDIPEAMYRARRVPSSTGQSVLFPHHSTTETYYVGIRYAAGDGAVDQRGHAYVSTYRENGGLVGDPLQEPNAEYDLYLRATQISESYDADHRPAPSAVYELLRFGRIIDTAHETLTPADVPHWRRIRTPEGDGWVNLNAEGIRKFSDADFPHWKEWQLIDDSADEDSRCDSPTIKGWLDKNGDGLVDAAEPLEGVREQAMLSRLEHCICKFPTEWDASTLEKRWRWLTDAKKVSFEPLDDNDFRDFLAHGKALCFWEEAKAKDANLPENPWRFHPRQFVQTFRKCGWLSTGELAQCIPRRYLHLSGTIFSSHVAATWGVAMERSGIWNQGINKACRKYSIGNSRSRQIHFLAQLSEECGFFRLVKEGNGEQASYAPYYGRGLIQLTHESNYRLYGKFRNFLVNNPSSDPPFQALGWNPDALLASSNSVYNVHNCADSAALYWTCSAMTAVGVNALTISDAGIDIVDAIRASRATNGNVPQQNINGLATRLQAFVYLKSILLDALQNTDTLLLSFAWRRNSSQEPLFSPDGQPVLKPNGTQKIGYVSVMHSINVFLEKQRP